MAKNKSLLIDKSFIDICNKISTTEDDISAICKSANTTYYKIYKQAEISSEHRDILEGSLVDRSLLFFESAKKIVDNIEAFWDATYVDRKGEHDVKKERGNAHHIAKVKIDFYMRACEIFAPMLFGDKTKELREVQKGIAELSLQLEGKINSSKDKTEQYEIV